MNHKLLSIAALCATMMACNSSKTETTIPTSVELPGTVDNEAFANNVESISVMNLQMDDKWSLASNRRLAFADNYTYLLVPRQLDLLCFDNKTGEIISSRTIKGNGPGEINYLNSIFCIGDTLCVYDHNRIVRQYDQKCAFLGKICELDESFMNYNMLRLSNGDYAMVSTVNTTSDTSAAVLMTDNQFNVKSRHFKSPQCFIIISFGSAPFNYVNGDIIRLFLMYDNHLYTICDNTEQSIELVLPNPITQDNIGEIMAGDPPRPNDYDGLYSGLSESGRFISFSYNYDKKRYCLMLDKRTNNVVSVSFSEDFEESATGLMLNLFKNGDVFQTDGKYLYAKCKNSDMASILEGHDDLLDARLKETQAQYRAYLERNADYMKGLEPEERNAANVILKIKLKD